MAKPGENQPNPDELKALVSADWDGPVVMLNLLKFSEKAHYEDGDRGMTGRDAFNRYGELAAPHISAAGAHIVYRGNVKNIVIGDEAEGWDTVIVVQYPSRQAFFDMITSAEYQELSKNRTAALDRSALIATKPTI